MEAHGAKREDKILILDGNKADLGLTRECLNRQVPGAQITPSSSIEEYRDVLKNNDFDIVVIDYEISTKNPLQLVHELKLKDYEPGVLVVCRSSDPRLVADIYSSGCHKCIVKDAHWLEELGPAVRHLLRIRKLEEENRRLVAKLTEANMLLQDKNKRLDEFSATVAHDIRGPLGGISMKLDYILETYQSKIDPRCDELLNRCLGSTQRLTQIVQSMYEYAKLGSKAARMTQVDLTRLVEEVISDMHFKESLDIKIGLAELPSVWGNPDLLRRVFINLLTNAVKYNDKKEIIINIALKGMAQKSIANFAEIYIEDNGPGIHESDVKNIFSMFTRGSHNTDGKEGAGVGLAVVHRIIELHFGKVSVESSLGNGTRFYLTLPLERIDFMT